MKFKKMCDIIAASPHILWGWQILKNGRKKLGRCFIEENENWFFLYKEVILGVKLRINLVQNLKMHNWFIFHIFLISLHKVINLFLLYSNRAMKIQAAGLWRHQVNMQKRVLARHLILFALVPTGGTHKYGATEKALQLKA